MRRDENSPGGKSSDKVGRYPVRIGSQAATAGAPYVKRDDDRPCEYPGDEGSQASHWVALVEMKEIPVLTVFPKSGSGPPSELAILEWTRSTERNDAEVFRPDFLRVIRRDDCDEAAKLSESSREFSNYGRNTRDR